MPAARKKNPPSLLDIDFEPTKKQLDAISVSVIRKVRKQAKERQKLILKNIKLATREAEKEYKRLYKQYNFNPKDYFI